MWDARFGVLVAAGHRVVRCDFRGYGDTPVAEHPYTDAGDVLGLMDALGIERRVRGTSSRARPRPSRRTCRGSRLPCRPSPVPTTCPTSGGWRP
ncbi:alpha/beta fold hydrolase [Streptomyces sp. NPDC015127]|uniref:alpha/beta fold hydrolase n=1 Tax=Streptomyces sp. NPDC015127 TaxID=3364939 RepID=UPI003700865E